MGQPIKETLFDFSPEVKGTTVWLDARTIEFKPAKNLAPDKLYEIHFKLADAKRINDKTITSFPPAWVGYLNKLKNEGYFADKLDTKKVIFDFSYAEIVIRNLKNEDIASLTRQPIPNDSIQLIINRYQTHFNEGIGFTIIVEYFDKMSNTSSAYFTFFDIASKKIIMNRNYSTSNNTQGYGMTKYWGNSLSETIFNYFERFYKKDLNAK